MTNRTETSASTSIVLHDCCKFFKVMKDRIQLTESMEKQMDWQRVFRTLFFFIGGRGEIFKGHKAHCSNPLPKNSLIKECIVWFLTI